MYIVILAHHQEPLLLGLVSTIRSLRIVRRGVNEIRIVRSGSYEIPLKSGFNLHPLPMRPTARRSTPAAVTLRSLCASALVLACHTPGPGRTSPAPATRATAPRDTQRDVQRDARPRVPASPPNQDLTERVAREVYSPANITQGDSLLTGPFRRDMLWVWFQDAASRQERQAAIDLIDGIVVGGKPIRAGGVYYVRIHADSTTRPLRRAMATLKSLPQVRTVSVDLSLIVGDVQTN